MAMASFAGTLLQGTCGLEVRLFYTVPCKRGIENASGSLFDNCQVHAFPKLARHDDSVKDLYEATLKVIPENFFQLKEVGNL